jgi:SagB-type dehydrogenase family enzyme
VDRRVVVVLGSLVFILVLFELTNPGPKGAGDMVAGKSISGLPEPKVKGDVSVYGRRSVRSFSDKPITLEQLSQLLWSAQGITEGGRLRAAPSAGATYPLTVYAVVSDVSGLDAGLYRYVPRDHRVVKVKSGDVASPISKATYQANMVASAPAVLILSANFSRTTKAYGDKGVMYVHMEAGHVGENIYLQAYSLGLGTVAVGAFDDKAVAQTIGLSPDEKPLYIYPVGVV